MFKQEVQNQIQQHYDKLISLGYNVVGVFLYGSQNYELDYSGSDVDSKAIILPTLNDIVFNRQPVSTTLDMGNGCLCDVKDIRKMFECFKKQNINFVELLFTQYYILNPMKNYSHLCLIMPKKLQGTTIMQVLIVCAEWHLKSTKLLHIRIQVS